MSMERRSAWLGNAAGSYRHCGRNAPPSLCWPARRPFHIGLCAELKENLNWAEQRPHWHRGLRNTIHAMNAPIRFYFSPSMLTLAVYLLVVFFALLCSMDILEAPSFPGK